MSVAFFTFCSLRRIQKLRTGYRDGYRNNRCITSKFQIAVYKSDRFVNLVIWVEAN